jgi:hypothetical protein
MTKDINPASNWKASFKYREIFGGYKIGESELMFHINFQHSNFSNLLATA